MGFLYMSIYSAFFGEAYFNSVFLTPPSFASDGYIKVNSLVPKSMLSTASTPIMQEWSWFATSYLYEPKRPKVWLHAQLS